MTIIIWQHSFNLIFSLHILYLTPRVKVVRLISRPLGLFRDSNLQITCKVEHCSISPEATPELIRTMVTHLSVIDRVTLHFLFLFIFNHYLGYNINIPIHLLNSSNKSSAVRIYPQTIIQIKYQTIRTLKTIGLTSHLIRFGGTSTFRNLGKIFYTFYFLYHNPWLKRSFFFFFNS